MRFSKIPLHALSREYYDINNTVSQAKCFDSYDFVTLYTNIPHEGLKMNIRNLVREAFKVKGLSIL